MRNSSSVPPGPPSAHWLRGRALNADEVAMVRAVFGDTLNYDAVRLRRCGLIALYADGVTIRNTIFLSNRCYRADYAADSVRVSLQGLLAHELMHVWQFQNLPAYHWLKAGIEHLRFHGRVYDYELEDPIGRNYQASTIGDPRPGAAKNLLDYRYEQQGRIIQDYFMLKKIGRDVSLYTAMIGDLFR